MQREAGRVAVVVVGLTLGGCADRTVSEVDPEQYPVEQLGFPLVINREVDIVFVIDNSISMEDEQDSLGANFDRFINVLDNLDGGLPDLHLGVATSNMGSLNVLSSPCAGLGDNGQMHIGNATVGLPITSTTERFLIDVEGATPGTRVTNYSGDLRSAFASIASVGAAGCGFEQHLESMRAALVNTGNGSFLRPEASLAIVIVADEDDCSASVDDLFGNDPALGLLDSFRCFEYGVECDEADLRAPGAKTNCRPREPSLYLHDIARYVDQLRTLKPDPNDVIVAGILGDREPVTVGTAVTTSGVSHPTLNASCTYHPPGVLLEQSADPAVRIGAFLDAFAGHGQQETICQDDLSQPLHDIGELILNGLGNPCLVGMVAEPVECSVTLVSPSTSIDPIEDVLPACDATASVQPCWRLTPDPRCTDYPTGLAVEVVRTIPPPPGTRIAASCVVE